MGQGEPAIPSLGEARQQERSLVEVISRVESIDFSRPDVAAVNMQAALVGKREGAALFDVDGDLYRIDLELVRESGDWRVISADWEHQ